MTYITTAVAPARPPAAVRTEREDWNALSNLEQIGVTLYLYDTSGMVTLNEVPLRGREYLRRHGRIS